MGGTHRMCSRFTIAVAKLIAAGTGCKVIATPEPTGDCPAACP